MTNTIDKKTEFSVTKAVEQIIGEQGVETLLQAKLPGLRQNRPLSVSPQTSDRVQTRDLQTLDANELKSVYALLAYIAHNENIRQETVQTIVEASFGVNHIAKLRHKDYEDVIRFLVDLRIDEMKN